MCYVIIKICVAFNNTPNINITVGTLVRRKSFSKPASTCQRTTILGHFKQKLIKVVLLLLLLNNKIRHKSFGKYLQENQ